MTHLTTKEFVNYLENKFKEKITYHDVLFNSDGIGNVYQSVTEVFDIKLLKNNVIYDFFNIKYDKAKILKLQYYMSEYELKTEYRIILYNKVLNNQFQFSKCFKIYKNIFDGKYYVEELIYKRGYGYEVRLLDH